MDSAIAARDGALDDAGRRLAAARQLIDKRESLIVEQRVELAAAKSRVIDLEQVASKLSERVVARERELKDLRAELSGLHTSSDQAMQALIAVGSELTAIRSQARGQATRIRMEALAEASELSDKLASIAQRPLEVRERLVAALSEALSQFEPGGEPDEVIEVDVGEAADAVAAIDALAAAPADAAEAADLSQAAIEADVEPVVEATPADPISELAAEVEAAVGSEVEPVVIAAPNGGGAVDEGGTGARQLVHPKDLFAGRIEVEIGPLDDFSQLVGFEDAASGIAGTSEIAVKRFAKGRATLEMRLDAPIELLRELEGRAPFEFKVRDTRDDRVILDLDSK